MKIPKKYKLHLAAAQKPKPETGLHLDCVHLIDNELIASDGAAAAVVPVDGGDLPSWESNEHPESARIPLRAFSEATRGKIGEGHIQLGAWSTEASSGHNKPSLVIQNPEPVGDVPNFGHVFAMCDQKAPDSHEYVEVCLDAERLANVASAIGSPNQVRLRFLVNKETHRADQEGQSHGVIEVTPVRPEGGERAMLMIHVVNE